MAIFIGTLWDYLLVGTTMVVLNLVLVLINLVLYLEVYYTSMYSTYRAVLNLVHLWL